MRILLVHNRYRSTSPGGEDRVVDQEHQALADAGHEVRRFERLSDDIDRLSLREKALLPIGAVWNPRTRRALDGVLADWRPDIAHFHNLFPLLSPAVLRACQEHRVPCVVTFHNYQQVCVSGTLYRDGAECTACVGRLPLPAVRHGCYHGSAAATVPIATSLVVNRRLWQTVPSAYLFLSEAQRREVVVAGFPPERCFVKSNLVLAGPPPAPPAPPGRPAGEQVIAYMGRLADAKGVRVLMRAWDRIDAAPAGGTLRLEIAGSGPLEPEVHAWARTHASVRILGLLDREQCAVLARRAAAVVVPSEWREPFGLVVAEAMAAGVPPVATTQGAFPELITDGVDGLLYPPGDDAALAAILLGIASSPEQAGALGAAARRTYEQRFAVGPVVAQLERVYRFAIDHPRWDGEVPLAHPAACTETLEPPAEVSIGAPATASDDAPPLAFGRPRYPAPAVSLVRAARRWRAPRLTAYQPRSVLCAPAHAPERARVPAVDFHTHLGRWLSPTGDWMEKDVQGVLASMDEANVAIQVNLDGRWGQELEENLDRYDRAHPGRFVTFCHVDWRLLARPGGAEHLAASLRRSVASGARGLKVWKDLGLTVKVGGRRLMPDDPMLGPLWEAAGDAGVPVLIHVADPVAFFLPADRHNERLEELLRFPGAQHGGGLELYRRLIDALEATVAAHPRTSFVAAHGCAPEDIARVDALLGRYQNLSIDIAAAVSELGRQPRAVRDLILRHPGQVLFGTDVFPMRPAARRVYFRLLETADEAFDYSDEPAPPNGRWPVYGLELPTDVLRRVYRDNALTLLTGSPRVDLSERSPTVPAVPAVPATPVVPA